MASVRDLQKNAGTASYLLRRELPFLRTLLLWLVNTIALWTTVSLASSVLMKTVYMLGVQVMQGFFKKNTCTASYLLRKKLPVFANPADDGRFRIRTASYVACAAARHLLRGKLPFCLRTLLLIIRFRCCTLSTTHFI